MKNLPYALCLIILGCFVYFSGGSIKVDKYPQAASLNAGDRDYIYFDELAPPEWQQDITKAERIWERKANCPSGVSVHIMELRNPKDVAVAVAMHGRCKIWVRRDQIAGKLAADERERCFILAHEYGHVLGLDHVLGTLMNPILATNMRVPACGDEPHPGDPDVLPRAYRDIDLYAASQALSKQYPNTYLTDCGNQSPAVAICSITDRINGQMFSVKLTRVSTDAKGIDHFKAELN